MYFKQKSITYSNGRPGNSNSQIIHRSLLFHQSPKENVSYTNLYVNSITKII